MPCFGDWVALENTDEKSRYVITYNEQSRAICHNTCCPNQTRVRLLEQVVVDQADREFSRHRGQFEENLVQPKKLEDLRALQELYR